MIIRRAAITYQHPVKVYVPVWQKDFDKDGELLPTPTFEYSYSDATQDEQLAWSLEPDYVLELTGEFKATTKPIEIEEDK